MDSVARTCVIFFFMSVGTLPVHGADLGESCSSGSCNADPLIKCRDGFCVCESGYVHNRTVEYTKEECVPITVKTKNHGESCARGQCLGNLVCKLGQCACPFHWPTYNAQNKVCEKSGRNESCLACSGRETAGPCVRGRDSEGLLWAKYVDGCMPSGKLVCVSGNATCECGQAYVNYNAASKTCELGYSGDVCVYSGGCHAGVNDVSSGFLICEGRKCTCDDKFPVWDVGLRACRKFVHGEQCTEDDACVESLECRNGHCACEPSFTILDSHTKTCKKTNLDACSEDKECAHSQGLKCVNKMVCACQKSYHQFNATSSSCMAMKLEGGGKCFENGVWNHSLCESGVCVGEDTNQVDLEGRCACANESGMKHFYSRNDSDGILRCIRDYSGSGCDRDIYCYPNGVETNQYGNGLLCSKSDVCACDQANHVYFLGHCVEAYRSYNETCDPYGVTQSTCKIDPAIALVCREHSPGNGKCECRKMGMNSTDGKMIFVDLSWNATAQKCELEMKKEGMMCKADDECQSGDCDPSGSAAKCAPMPGAGIQIQSGKILIIVITAIFTMLK